MTFQTPSQRRTIGDGWPPRSEWSTAERQIERAALGEPPSVIDEMRLVFRPTRPACRSGRTARWQAPGCRNGGIEWWLSPGKGLPGLKVEEAGEAC